MTKIRVLPIDGKWYRSFVVNGREVVVMIPLGNVGDCMRF